MTSSLDDSRSTSSDILSLAGSLHFDSITVEASPDEDISRLVGMKELLPPLPPKDSGKVPNDTTLPSSLTESSMGCTDVAYDLRLADLTRDIRDLVDDAKEADELSTRDDFAEDEDGDLQCVHDYLVSGSQCGTPRTPSSTSEAYDGRQSELGLEMHSGAFPSSSTSSTSSLINVSQLAVSELGTYEQKALHEDEESESDAQTQDWGVIDVQDGIETTMMTSRVGEGTQNSDVSIGQEDASEEHRRELERVGYGLGDVSTALSLRVQNLEGNVLSLIRAKSDQDTELIALRSERDALKEFLISSFKSQSEHQARMQGMLKEFCLTRTSHNSDVQGTPEQERRRGELEAEWIRVWVQKEAEMVVLRVEQDALVENLARQGRELEVARTELERSRIIQVAQQARLEEAMRNLKAIVESKDLEINSLEKSLARQSRELDEAKTRSETLPGIQASQQRFEKMLEELGAMQATNEAMQLEMARTGCIDGTRVGLERSLHAKEAELKALRDTQADLQSRLEKVTRYAGGLEEKQQVLTQAHEDIFNDRQSLRRKLEEATRGLREKDRHHRLDIERITRKERMEGR